MAEDLNEVIEEVVSDAEVMTVAIDDTLTVSGEAADAKAVGDALALKADKSELQNSISVNGEEADSQGRIIIDAGEIEMTEGGGVTVKSAIEAAGERTAEEIPMSSATDAPSVSEAIGSTNAAILSAQRVKRIQNNGTTSVRITTVNTIEAKTVFLVVHRNTVNGMVMVSGSGSLNNITSDPSAALTASVSGNTITLTGNNLYYADVTVIAGVDFTLAAGS